MKPSKTLEQLQQESKLRHGKSIKRKKEKIKKSKKDIPSNWNILNSYLDKNQIK